MPVSDDVRAEMWAEVFRLCKVQPEERVVILTGETVNQLNLDASMRTAVSFGTHALRLQLPPMRPRGPHGGDRTAFLGVTPLTGHQLATETLKQADFVVDLLGLLHSKELTEILAAKTRVLMVLEPPEILAQMMPSADDKRRVTAAESRLKKAKKMRVTSRAGTDLSMELGAYKPLAEYGFVDEPGRWDHWPSGFIATWPNDRSANGQVVLDVGDVLLPFKMYVSSPITMEIRDGFIQRIDGGLEATYLRRHIDAYQDPDAYAVAHVGWGLQPKAKWTALGARDKSQSLAMDARAYCGNFLFSTGPNAEAGGRNNSPCHVDIPMAGCSVFVDGEAMTQEGRVVASDQRVDS